MRIDNLIPNVNIKAKVKTKANNPKIRVIINKNKDKDINKKTYVCFYTVFFIIFLNKLITKFLLSLISIIYI